MARAKTANPKPSAPLGEEQVADYLRANPDFLKQNPALLDILTPPDRAQGNGIVDFQQVMIERTQAENARLKSTSQELIETTRSNLQSQHRIHAVTLELINAASFEHFVETITTDLAIRLDVDAIALCIEHDGDGPMPRPSGGVRMLPPGAVDRLLSGGAGAAANDGQTAPDRNTHILRSDIKAERAIYGGAATLVRSDALIRLAISEQSPPGLLAVGAREPDHFSPQHGPDLLLFLAQVIESLTRAWLDLPA